MDESVKEDVRFNLEEWLVQQESWSRRTFGSGRRTNGICKHIEMELTEILDSPDDLMEWIDIIILALDGAWRTGHTSDEICTALQDKQRININRTWDGDKSKDCPVEHTKLLCKCGKEIIGMPHRSVVLLEDGECDDCHKKNIDMFVESL